MMVIRWLRAVPTFAEHEPVSAIEIRWASLSRQWLVLIIEYQLPNIGAPTNPKAGEPRLSPAVSVAFERVYAARN